MSAKIATLIVVGALFTLLHPVASDNYTTGVNMMSASNFVILAGTALVNVVSAKTTVCGQASGVNGSP